MTPRRRTISRPLVVGLCLLAVCTLLFVVSGSLAIVLIALPGLTLSVLLFSVLIGGDMHSSRGSGGADPYLSIVFGGSRASASDIEATHGETLAAQIAPDRRPSHRPPRSEPR